MTIRGFINFISLTKIKYFEWWRIDGAELTKKVNNNGEKTTPWGTPEDVKKSIKVEGGSRNVVKPISYVRL